MHTETAKASRQHPFTLWHKAERMMSSLFACQRQQDAGMATLHWPRHLSRASGRLSGRPGCLSRRQTVGELSGRAASAPSRRAQRPGCLGALSGFPRWAAVQPQRQYHLIRWAGLVSGSHCSWQLPQREEAQMEGASEAAWWLVTGFRSDCAVPPTALAGTARWLSWQTATACSCAALEAPLLRRARCLI